MSVFNRMVTAPLWRRNDARQQQQRQGKLNRGPKRPQQRTNPEGSQTSEVQRPHPPGFNLVPRELSTPMRMWMNGNTNHTFATYILHNRENFNQFYQQHHAVCFKSGSVSITDLCSLRLYLNLHPRDLLGLSSLHAARTRFQLVLAELLATPRELSALHVRYTLVPCNDWALRPFDGAISNLTTLEVARFLSEVGLSKA